MRPTKISLAALAVAGLLGAGTYVYGAQAEQNNPPNNGQTNEQRSNSQEANGTNQNNYQAPVGWVLVREDTLVLTAAEPQDHFLRAQQFLDQKDFRQAAGEVRMAAVYLEMQSAHGNGQAEDSQLKQESQRLRQLARQIEQSNASAEKQDQKDFRQDFAQSEIILAQHLQQLAKSELQKNRPEMAGHDLNSSADSLAAAFVWSNQQTPAQANTAIQNAQSAALQLMANANAGTGNPAGNNNNNEAQPAGAKMNGQNGNQNANPSQAIDELGNAIQQSQSTLHLPNQNQPQNTPEK